MLCDLVQGSASGIRGPGEQEVIHISNIAFDPETLFNVVVQVVQDRQLRDLGYLAA